MRRGKYSCTKLARLLVDVYHVTCCMHATFNFPFLLLIQFCHDQPRYTDLFDYNVTEQGLHGRAIFIGVQEITKRKKRTRNLWIDSLAV